MCGGEGGVRECLSELEFLRSSPSTEVGTLVRQKVMTGCYRSDPSSVCIGEDDLYLRPGVSGRP